MKKTATKKASKPDPKISSKPVSKASSNAAAKAPTKTSVKKSAKEAPKAKSSATTKAKAKKDNANKVFIGLLGEKGSGRTYTWQKIFNTRVHTSKNTRRFFLDGIDYIEVFLINGSPIERKTDVKNILGDKQPEFVLCSLEYKPGVEKTIDFFLAEGYRMYIIYLKPGYSDNKGLELFEDYSLVGKLISAGVTVSIRSGKENPERRISEIRELALGWAVANDKLKAD